MTRRGQLSDINSPYTSVSYWDGAWSGTKPGRKIDVPFRNALLSYLPHDESMSCIELGCIPGIFLVFMKKNFGYQIYGLDYSSAVGALAETMRFHGISDYVFY